MIVPGIVEDSSSVLAVTKTVDRFQVVETSPNWLWLDLLVPFTESLLFT